MKVQYNLLSPALPPLSSILKNKPMSYTLSVNPQDILLKRSSDTSSGALSPTPAPLLPLSPNDKELLMATQEPFISDEECNQLYSVVHHLYGSLIHCSPSNLGYLSPSSSSDGSVDGGLFNNNHLSSWFEQNLNGAEDLLSFSSCNEPFSPTTTTTTTTTTSEHQDSSSLYDSMTAADALFRSSYTHVHEELAGPSPVHPPLLQSPSILSTIDSVPLPVVCSMDLDFSAPAEEEVAMKTGENNNRSNSNSNSSNNKKKKQVMKKSRKNYSTDTIDVLMDWYITSNGRSPCVEEKKKLADATGKTEAQIGTWFQNARRRHILKLQNYKALSKRYPSVVYDYKSFKAFLKNHDLKL